MGTKLRPKQAQMKDIETASSKARESIQNLKQGDFSPDQVLKLQKAMSEEDAGAVHTLMQNLAMRATTEAQQDFIIWITQLNERAMSLRNIAGMGAGAQDLRNAIRAMLPGLGSGNTKMMLKQLDAFDQQVKVLEEGVPSPGKGGSGKLVGQVRTLRRKTRWGFYSNASRANCAAVHAARIRREGESEVSRLREHSRRPAY